MTLYAGPAAGDYLADHADSMFGFPLGLVTGSSTECFGSSSEAGSTTEECTDSFPMDGFPGEDDSESDGGPSIADDLTAKFRDFKGMAATLRFNDGAIEFEVAGDSHLSGQFLLADGGASADVVESLPADTAAAYGLGFADGWFGDMMDHVRVVLRRELPRT